VPEGDTIYRAARALDRALAGRTVSRFETVFPHLTRVDQDRPLAGRTVERVESRGKHLLMFFSGELVLRTHMRMNGSWHIYRPGERWLRPHRDMRLRIATDDFEAVGFNIPVAELIEVRDLKRHAELTKLGPDVLSDTFDAEEALRRMRDRADTAIADAILNQRVIAGLGNVYKSEVLFLCRVNPFTPVRALEDKRLAGVIAEGRRLLRANVSEGLAPMTTYTGFRRTTRRDDPAERLWVYGRARLPCRRCGTPIQIRKQGTDARLTYWCPSCQPETEGLRA
jgi:endonuclease-8